MSKWISVEDWNSKSDNYLVALSEPLYGSLVHVKTRANSKLPIICGRFEYDAPSVELCCEIPEPPKGDE